MVPRSSATDMSSRVPDYPPGSRLAVEYPPGWPISLAGAVVIRTICDLPIICDPVTLAVAWTLADLAGRTELGRDEMAVDDVPN
jgi:hypothetical protein